jgi:outer membrane protein assembly factor BamB
MGQDGVAETVVLESWDRVSGHDPKTGDELWVYRENQNCIPSSAVFENVVLAPSSGLTALRPVSGSESPEVAWRSSKLRPGTASPVVQGDRVYTLSSAGILTCGSASDGEVFWQLRLKGPFSSTPVASADRLYCINESGLAHVVGLGETGELLGTTELGETILATPAIADGAIFVRSDRTLWKFAKAAGSMDEGQE